MATSTEPSQPRSTTVPAQWLPLLAVASVAILVAHWALSGHAEWRVASGLLCLMICPTIAVVAAIDAARFPRWTTVLAAAVAVPAGLCLPVMLWMRAAA